MENKILFGNDSGQAGKAGSSNNGNQVKPNLFPGRTEAETKNAKFPDWDIVPPNQFINPRIKQQ